MNTTRNPILTRRAARTIARFCNARPRRIFSRRSLFARSPRRIASWCRRCARYSADDGVANDWHFQNLASRAVGGAGIVFTEVAHTEPPGRITPYCLGLWNDAQRDALVRIVRFVKSQGAVAGIQLGHAGRKGSTARPWDGGKPIAPADGGWEIIAPSAIAFGEGYAVPVAMDKAMIMNPSRSSSRTPGGRAKPGSIWSKCMRRMVT